MLLNHSLTQTKVSSDDVLFLEETLTPEFIKKSIASMQSGKAAGPDGFPADFYKKFSDKLVPLLHAMYTESFQTKTLPPTLYHATISLLLKKDKDPQCCSSFRPISLLNQDFKILAKALGLRLEKLLPSIISNDQTGFIRGRQSFCNVRRLLNILHTPSQHSGAEAVISLDAEKAFDRVEWDYLFFALEKFGFGHNFISWIRLLYTSPMASVLTNYQMSDHFYLGRGTRQGCPLSPLLFSIAIEPLVIALRQDDRIEGITRGGQTHKVSLYADDLLLFLSNPDTTLPHVLSLLSSFGAISGYKLNLNKSEYFPITPSHPLQIDIPFKIVKDSFKYLGVTITRTYSKPFQANFTPLLERCKADFARWAALPLSLIGKLNSVKMNILPKFLYLFQCLPIFITCSFFKTLQRLISDFIWAGKRARIRKEFLERPKRLGGLSAPNFQLYYWASNLTNMSFWLLSSDSANCPAWVNIEASLCHPYSLSALLGALLPLPVSIPKRIVVVWHSLRILRQFKLSFGLQSISLFSPLSYNPLFPPSSHSSAFKTWHDKGIQKLEHLYIDGVFASFTQLKEKFALPRSPFFQYLQVRDFIRKKFPDFPSLPPKTHLDHIINMLLHSQKGRLAKVYEYIISINMPSLTIIKQHWEEELGFNISDDIWDAALDRVHSSSICARHSLIQFKVLHRLHYCKTALTRIYPDIDPLCDRCKMLPATLYHMFWGCPDLDRFWYSFFDSFSKIFKKTVTPCPLMAIFGVTAGNTSLTSWQRRALAFSSLLARRLILLNWKNSAPPTHTHLIRSIMCNLKLEKIRYTVSGALQNFHRTWDGVVEFVKRLDGLQLE